MTIAHIEVHHSDRTVETFFPLSLPAPRNLVVGDLVKVRSGVTNKDWEGIGCLSGRIGVIRGLRARAGWVAVEWAGFDGGHGIDNLAHAPNSGWYVPEKYLEPA